MRSFILMKFFFSVLVLFLCIAFAISASAYPFATFVMDAKSGEKLYSQNATQKLHPASLTKMMTLYLVFHEVESKRLSLDQKTVISKNAAREPPSKFGYKVGQRVSIRHLIRAAAIRSANDAATALAEAVSGSEREFGIYMSRVAQEMGMSNTVFKNANGLTSTGHLSTAEDMAILSRRLIYDFPEYYHLFGRTTVISSGRTLYNTNRKFLANYRGADGIKTGFTSAAGYNLAASAKRGNKRVIAVIFGSGSVSLRVKRVGELLDIGFARSSATKRRVKLPKLSIDSLRKANIGEGALKISFKPVSRPNFAFTDELEPNHLMNETIDRILNSDALSAVVSPKGDGVPLPRPLFFENESNVSNLNRDNSNLLAAKLLKLLDEGNQAVKYKILVGSYYTQYNAKKDLPKLTLIDFDTLSNAERQIIEGVVNRKKVFRLGFNGLSLMEAEKACKKLIARQQICEVMEETND